MTEPTKRLNEVIASNIVAGVEVARFDDTAYLTVEDLKTKIREQLDEKDSKIAQLLEAAKIALEFHRKLKLGIPGDVLIDPTEHLEEAIHKLVD